MTPDSTDFCCLFPCCSDDVYHVLLFAENSRSAETDVTSMVMSRTTEAGSICQLVDMGAFHLAEFAQTLCLPFVGSAVHGGVHVVQVVAQKLAIRMLMVPPLDDTFKVCILAKFPVWHLWGQLCMAESM